ncbi:hypothetical protein PIB30_090249 [Stylosanthes scabra]|uniref:Uncharacterized protein n=1 Tax=Stylosanthes scabra TaxID=79078 RepID=A0ABU6TX55_9FABA|nr:hypothetical protein [Stylosanthes scabra]
MKGVRYWKALWAGDDERRIFQVEDGSNTTLPGTTYHVKFPNEIRAALPRITLITKSEDPCMAATYLEQMAWMQYLGASHESCMKGVL